MRSGDERRASPEVQAQVSARNLGVEAERRRPVRVVVLQTGHVRRRRGQLALDVRVARGGLEAPGAAVEHAPGPSEVPHAVEDVPHASVRDAQNRQGRRENGPEAHLCRHAFEPQVVVPVELVAVSPRVPVRVPSAPVVTLHATPPGDLGRDAVDRERAAETGVGRR
jgi:hypothetical protein